MKTLPATMANMALPISDQNSIVVLAANTVETVAIPTGARFMIVQASAVTVFLFDSDPANIADNVDGDGGMFIGANCPPLLIELPETLPTNVRFNAAGASTVGVGFYGRQR